MTPAQAELLHHHRRTIADLDKQIAVLSDGTVRFLRGNEDATEDALALARAQREALQALVDRHDPDGFTKIV
jgi:hypothetical protein